MNKTDTQAIERRIRYHRDILEKEFRKQKSNRCKRDIDESELAIKHLNKFLGRKEKPKKQITGAKKLTFLNS